MLSTTQLIHERHTRPRSDGIVTYAAELYVNPQGSDLWNGKTIDTPFATITRAIEEFQRKYDFSYMGSAFGAIRAAKGTYLESLYLPRMHSHWGAGTPQFGLIGDGVTPAEYILNPQSQRCGINMYERDWWVEGFTVDMTDTHGSSSAICFGANSTGAYIANMKFKLNGQQHAIQGYGAQLDISYGNIEIEADAFGGFLKLDEPAYVYAGDINALTITGAGAMSSAWITATDGARAKFWYAALTGAATGNRYNIRRGGAVHTYGEAVATAAWTPGNAAGTVDTATYGQLS
jgi:hypothetical protein